MGLRQKLNQNSSIVTLVTILAVIAAGYVLFKQVSGPPAARLAFYSSDDGQSWFEDDINKAPPFMKDGKEAVIAHLFTCEGKKFVGYLETFTPEYKALFEKAQAETANAAITEKSGPPGGSLKAMVALKGDTGRLYKKPGAKEWHMGMSAQGTDMTFVKCPDGSMAESVTLPGYLGH